MIRAVARLAHGIPDSGVAAGILPVKGHVVDAEISVDFIVYLIVVLVAPDEAAGGVANVGQAKLTFQDHLEMILIGVFIGSKSCG